LSWAICTRVRRHHELVVHSLARSHDVRPVISDEEAVDASRDPDEGPKGQDPGHTAVDEVADAVAGRSW
jgi:hypothetical protein